MRILSRTVLAAAMFVTATPLLQAQLPPVQKVAVANGELAYRVIGQGEPLLLVHGSVFADAMAPLLGQPALASYQLIQYHRRGYGASSEISAPFTIAQQAADMVALLDHLKIAKAHIAGHSYGGAIALQLQRDYPDRVASLTLLEPAWFEMTPAVQSLFTAAGEAIAMRAKEGDRAALERFSAAVAGPHAWENTRKAGSDAVLDQAVADAATFFDVELPASQTWQFTSADLAGVRVPVLAVVGETSHAAFLESHASIRKALPKAAALVVPGATHELQGTHPTAVAEGIAAFLKKHPLNGGGTSSP